VVEIFAFLDLDQISADFEIEHFSKVSSQLKSPLRDKTKVSQSGTFYQVRTGL
jgi:hypothetical protein